MSNRIEIIGVLSSGKTTFLDSCSRNFHNCRIKYVFEDLNVINTERKFWLNNPNQRSYFIQSVYYKYAADLIETFAVTGSVVIADFSLMAHHFVYSSAFRKLGFLEKIEFATLRNLMYKLESHLPPLIGAIHCNASIDTIMKRIKARGRIEESTINKEFIQLLLEIISEFISSLKTPILTINTEDFDPCSNNHVEQFKSFVGSIPRLSIE